MQVINVNTTQNPLESEYHALRVPKTQRVKLTKADQMAKDSIKSGEMVAYLNNQQDLVNNIHKRLSEVIQKEKDLDEYISQRSNRVAVEIRALEQAAINSRKATLINVKRSFNR